jgi:hypothetical protein
MTYEDYWNRDSTLVKAYRKAAKIRRDLENQQAWLNGMYVYSALCCAAPSFNSLKPRRPSKYPEQPFEFETEKEYEAKEKAEVKHNKQDMRAKTMMEIFALNFNERFKKGGGTDGK